MKASILRGIAAFSLALSVVNAETVANPVQHFASEHGLTGGDQIKKLEVDLNADGMNDVLLVYENPAPDIVERQARQQERGMVWWSAYVSAVDGGYIASRGIDKNGELNLGAGLPCNPDETHVGQVAEIARHALTGVFLTAVKGGTPTFAVTAYTWEGDHFKEHILTRFPEGEENALFEKYLAPEKRTQLTVQVIAL